MEHCVLEFSALSLLGVHVLKKERQRQRERLYVVRKKNRGAGGLLRERKTNSQRW